MSNLLPNCKNPDVIQSVGRITNAELAKLDSLIVITPHKISAQLWRQIPGAGVLRRINRRRQDATSLFTRLPNQRATGVWLQKLPDRSGDESSSEAYRQLKWAGTAVATALAEHPRRLGVVVLGLESSQIEHTTQAIVLAIAAHSFQMPEFRRKPSPHQVLKKLRLIGLEKRLDLSRTLAEADAINLARWLTALPANKLTTKAFRDVLEQLAKQNGWKSEFYSQTRLEKLGAGAFLAVAQGNADKDAGIVHLQYRPAHTRKKPRLALVGKGIIFDTGGNNLKPFKSMLDMHEDMGGSAVAVATLQALSQLRFPFPVDCWLAITENRIGPQAYKSRDIVTAMNGTTIEVIHTDAEGRMALADTLTLAGQQGAELILDYATLTGACHHSLTDRYSGVFTNRTALNGVLTDAGVQSGERVWPFPMDADYDDDLKSTVADVLQCSTSNEADQILAARFLKRFVPDNSIWIHLDLSAVTRKSGLGQVPPGTTGFGVRYTLNLLHDQADSLTKLLGRPLPVVTHD